MCDQNLLSTIAIEIGAAVRAKPEPPKFRTLPEFRAVFTALDESLLAMMRKRLHALRPEAVWADEFEGQLPSHGEVWVIDALDGAVQYLQGLPDWCVSITLLRDLQPVVSVLHSPALAETYAATLGAGATRNGRAIQPADKSELAAAFVATSQPAFVATNPQAVDLAGRSLSDMLRAVGAVRNLGATSWHVADVASGRLDGFWEYGVDDVNLLCAVLIAREAGARVTDVAGDPWRPGASSIVVAAPSLHAQLLSVLPADSAAA